LLLSADLPPPDEVIVHGFLTENGQKISKSRGSPIDPLDVTKEYGADAIRYYLLRGISSTGDSDFSTQRLKALYNSDLANGLGNLVSRLATLAQRANYGEHDSEIPVAPDGYHESLGKYRYEDALDALWDIVTNLNRQIEDERPWEALKQGNTAGLKRQLREWLTDLRRVAYWLQPFLPASAGAILRIISSNPITATPPLFPRAN